MSKLSGIVFELLCMGLIMFTFIICGIILFLSRRTKYHPHRHFQISPSYCLHWKKCCLMRAKSLHSMRKSLTVYGVWYTLYKDCSSCLSIKEWASLVRLMRNQDIVISSFLDFLKAGFYSPRVLFIRKSLLCRFLF